MLSSSPAVRPLEAHATRFAALAGGGPANNQALQLREFPSVDFEVPNLPVERGTRNPKPRCRAVRAGNAPLARRQRRFDDFFLAILESLAQSGGGTWMRPAGVRE